MATGAVIGAVVGSVGQAIAADKAEGAQTDAANLAIQQQRETLASQEKIAAQQQATTEKFFNIQRDDLAPYREAGAKAMAQMEKMLYGSPEDVNAGLVNTPGYQFRYDQGLKSLQASQAATTGTLSGRATLEAQRYGQDYASNEFSNEFGRLQSIANNGQTASAQGGAMSASGQINTSLAALSTATGVEGTNIGNLYNKIGDAQATSYISQGKYFNDGATAVGDYYTLKGG
jgi:hypothetical protein